MLHRAARPAIMLIACLIAFACIAPPAQATWSTDPSVNNPVEANGTTSAGSTSHEVCPDGAGGFFVGWDISGPASRVAVQHVLADGSLAPGWPVNGLPPTSIASSRGELQLAADGAGGVVLAWADNRNGNYDVYAQRIDGAGALLWGDGVRVGTSLKPEYPTGVASDGQGGMLVVWSLNFSSGDDDVYASHVLAAGMVDPAVSAAGITVAGSGAEELAPVIAPDNAGGCWIAWQDKRSGTDFDVYGSRFTSTLTYATGWLFGGLNLTQGLAGSNQSNPLITVDGAGGAYVAWYDLRSGVNADIYAGHVQPGLLNGSAWSSLGTAVVTEAASQYLVNICPDSTGGFYLMWDDYRYSPSNPYPFAQHLRVDGSRAPGWAVDGNRISNLPGMSAYGAPDGAGGLLAAWIELSTGGYDVVGTRLTADGALAPGWSSSGSPVCTASYGQIYPALLPDGTGGALVTWWDLRPMTSFAHYAQRIDGFGAVGDASPTIASVSDVRPDQGGHVLLEWNRSYLDAGPKYAIGGYWIWRQVPGAIAQQAARAGAAMAGATDDVTALAAAGRRVFAAARGGRVAATGYAWEFVVSQPANGKATYSYVAATLVDSSATVNPPTAFLVEAHATSGVAFWPSAPATGYSVDNLAPASPAPFLGSFAGGTTSMNWGINLESDFAGYRLYRGLGTGFTPGPGNLVAPLTTTVFADHAGAPYVYKLTAVDVHGNESSPAVLVTGGTAGVDDSAPTALALSLGSANPARAGVTLQFALPTGMHVRLALYDPQGRRVRSLADAPYAAGRYAARWDGLDESGARVADGLYFARLDAGGRVLREKLVTCH